MSAHVGSWLIFFLSVGTRATGGEASKGKLKKLGVTHAVIPGLDTRPCHEKNLFSGLHLS